LGLNLHLAWATEPQALPVCTKYSICSYDNLAAAQASIAKHQGQQL